MNWLETLTPQHVRDLVPYASARREASEGQVWLNANESPYTPYSVPPEQKLNRYPDFQPGDLLRAYASYAGVQTEQLLVTRGIDEGIDLLTRAFCRPGYDQILYTPPTYGMYKICAESLGVSSKPVPLGSGWQLDLPSMLAGVSESKLIYLCSPNNPTGNTLKREDIIDLLEATRERSLLVVDEAYIEFVPQITVQDLLRDYPHLIILRTLSKAFALAGLRCGFVMAAPEIIHTLQKTSAPYPIPVPIIALALQALEKLGIASMKSAVETIVKDRQGLWKQLEQYSFVKKVYPSEANFLLFQLEDAPALMKALKSSGVVIRDQSAQVGLGNTLRVTVGTDQELSQFTTAMQLFEENQ